MEQDDEEFEQLLHEIPEATSADPPNEIPRATSAPPHLEELQRVYGSSMDAHTFGLREDEVPVKPFIDIRCDEQYEDFYKSYSGAKKLPPPMDNRTLYNDMPVLSPKAASAQLSPFFSGLTLDSPRTRHRKHRQMEAHHKQQQQQQVQQEQQQQQQQGQNPQQQQREPSPNHHFGNSSQTQMFGESNLSSAFANLNFEGNSSRALQTLTDETVDNLTLGGHGGLGGGSLSNGQSPAESNSMYVNMDAFGVGSGTYGGGSVASLETYTTSRSPPGMNLFPRGKATGGIDALSNGVFNGMGDYPQVSSQVVEKLLRQGSPGLNAYTSRSEEAAFGSAVANVYQQQQLDVFEAMHAAAAVRGQASASASGADFFPPSSQQQMSYDYDVASLYEAQRMQVTAQAQMAALRYAQMEEEKRKQQQQQQRLILQQQLVDRQNQIQLLATLQAQNAGGFGRGTVSSAINPRVAASLQHTQAMQKLRQQQVVDGLWAQGLVLPDSSRTNPATSICRYYNQGYCSRGDVCPFLHSPSNGSTRAAAQSAALSVKEATRIAAVTRDERLSAFPEKILQRRPRASNGGTSTIPATGIRRKGDGIPNGHTNGQAHGYGNGHVTLGSGHISSPFLGDTQAHRTIQEELEFDPRLPTAHHLQQQQQPKYTKLEEVEGRIYLIAKDQHGCRFLQKKFDEGGPEDVEKIFHEIIGHITELMKDPFGNYLVQKLLEVCDEAQRMDILRVVTMDGELVKISLNMHGTRAVQKLIETLKSPEQVTMVITALTEGVVELIKDLNGNHVVQRCLQKLSHEDSQFIFDAAAAHCVEISTHRHGCCVMQRCVDFASAPQKQRLIAVIATHALVLSQDPYGNYVVQYILDLKTGWASSEVMARLEGNYAFLAMQKFSSNVVEKCLKLGVEEHRARLVRELTASPRLGQLLQDQYANYVIQSALSVCKGPLHTGLVDAIRPYLPALRNSPYGKRILSRTNIKK